MYLKPYYKTMYLKPFPQASFDIQSWFYEFFPKPEVHQRIIHWKFLHHKYISQDIKYNIDIYDGRRFVTFETSDPVSDKQELTGIEYEFSDLTYKFISCGVWDSPDFTDNERELAWRIHCLYKMT